MVSDVEKPSASNDVVSVHNGSESGSVRREDDLLLAKLGYKSEFRREFSLIETIAFSFSIMGVIASVSSTLSFPLAAGGHVGMVWGWLIPCPFVLCVAASLAELTSAMPTSAGLYYFSAKLAPPKYVPIASWITGWANVTGQVAAQMITTAITVGSDGAVVLGSGATYGILLAILVSHGVVCSAATRILARLNLFYVVINIGTTIAAIIALLVCSDGQRVSAKDAFTLFENNTGWSNNGWAFLLAFTSPMWTLTGYDSAAHVSEEVAGAARAAPIAIMVGVGATQLLGWLRGALAIWSCIIVVQFVTGAAQGVDASRVVFAFARDNALPGSRWWKRVNHHTQTPVNAVWLVMFGASLCGLLGFSATALASLAGASVIGLYTSYATPIFLRITSGRDKLIPGTFHLGRWSSPIGAVAVAWVAFINILLLFPPGQHTNAKSMNYAVVIIMGVFIYAALSWVVSARKWFKGPVSNLSKEPSLDEKNHLS
ncbi:amino acid/polyamine transporter I [Lactarius deliciosus]|nr:amino acid/polyamine transporter I [Lactarius deliciosus]